MSDGLCVLATDIPHHPSVKMLLSMAFSTNTTVIKLLFPYYSIAGLC